METVPRIHVQKLPTTAKQQYQAENKRGIPKAAATSRGNYDEASGQHDAIRGGTERARRHQTDADNDGQHRRHQREQGRGGQGAETTTTTADSGGGGTTQRLVAAEQVLLLRRRQTG